MRVKIWSGVTFPPHTFAVRHEVSTVVAGLVPAAPLRLARLNFAEAFKTTGTAL
jgi:hypothetical protein